MFFSTFYGQRSVTAAWATRSPWSIYSAPYGLFIKYAQKSAGIIQTPRPKEKSYLIAAGDLHTLSVLTTGDFREAVKNFQRGGGCLNLALLRSKIPTPPKNGNTALDPP